MLFCTNFEPDRLDSPLFLAGFFVFYSVLIILRRMFRSYLSWIISHRWLLFFVGVFICLQQGIFLLYRFSPPPGQVWLGDSILNSADQAVYLMNVEQIRSGAALLQNLYAPLPQQGYVVPFYVFLGFCARVFGTSAINTIEIARPLVTIIAFGLLFRLSRRVTHSIAEACWATFALTCFGGAGWIVSSFFSFAGWRFSFPIADIGSEAFFFPMAFAGIHIILSFALLAFSIEALWDRLAGAGSRPIWPLLVSTLFLLWIHPYFGLLLAIIGCMGLIVGWKRRVPIFYRSYAIVLIGCLGLLPHVLAHIQNETRRFAVLENHLSLGFWWVWVLACLPWLGFVFWRFRYGPVLQKAEEWLVVWLVAIPVSLLFPFHWKRKLFEGFGAILIWLSLPVFLSLVRYLRQKGRLYLILVCSILMLSPLSLLFSQIAWMDGSRGRGTELMVSEDAMKAWAWLRFETAPDGLILTDRVWIGTWTPTYSLRPVWIGHDFETPDWENKNRALQALFFDGTAEQARQLLGQISPTYVLITEMAQNARFSGLFSEKWEAAARFGSVQIWRQKSL